MMKMPLFIRSVALLTSLANAGHILRRQQVTFESPGNPILGDGSMYSADPAPLVVNETVYIRTGRDEADPLRNSVVMKEWQIFEAQSPSPEGGEWILHQNVAPPQEVFSWAQPGGAYASQIVQGADGRFYLYA